MNVKFLNPFVEAAYEVLTAETRQEVTRGDLKLENGTYLTDDLTVILSLVGAVEGTVFYSMSAATGAKLATILMGEKFDAVQGLAQSGVAEIGNVITGRASMKLSEAGFETTISPPTLLLGKGASISTLDVPRLIVPLMTVAGPVLIHLALRQGSANGLRAAQLSIPKAFQVP
ncbi:MAG TPA: chemotaxis protein CheX [Anaerolinea thermolimosa]|uniref:Chemotaxis protein CheX n=1 Tax=Anaerolinea thermolimosa TaxID=229919 RepID=A0A3D1JDN3_9CHLR|nr:chemotaxis protein CheX [Anaerolinea thermolimosa]GAP07888.1 predicted inhibitor of MCP methylation, homolog of CheC [Anaerolinea thermolimosa]HCE16295.1 chemotaxis protein CheX [Anaerolinea thermolimosa]